MRIGDAALYFFAIIYLWSYASIPFWHLWVAFGVSWAMNLAQSFIRDYQARKKSRAIEEARRAPAAWRYN